MGKRKLKPAFLPPPPRFAVLDPDDTMSVPFAKVMSKAFDTLSHAMETYFDQADRDNVSYGITVKSPYQRFHR